MSIYKGTTLIAGALPNAVNQDLSNLSQVGQAVIDGKADTDLSNLTSTASPNFDGVWIKPSSSSSIISSSTSVNGSTDLTYSIASIIPNDGYNYEVLFCCEGTTGATSGNEVTLRISSDITGDSDFCRAQTRTASAVKCGGTMMLPVSTSRKIYVSRATSWNGSITNLWINGYRRLGTNT